VTATIAIPARLRSSRLARKVLADLGGRTMLERTHEVAVRAGCGPVVVLTDDPEVAAEVWRFGGTAMMTRPEHASGTERIAEVVDELEGDVVVNLQADAPFTDPRVVADLADQARAGGGPVTMPVHPLVAEEEVHDPSVVKVVLDRSGRVLLCSRSPVPHVREAAGAWIDHAPYWGHPGLYAYSRDFLAALPGLPPSPLEDAERLEQLRWLEAGVEVRAFAVAPQGPSIDTPSDLERAREALLHEVAR
jgi:3-deoxy-manno-octulosonate cytidylyltransferase (CMP-KDO synthetase)